MNADNANPKVLDARVWQEASLANQYVNEVRAALPLAAEQTAMMLRIVSASVPEPKRFLDLGCGSGILGAAMLDCFPNAHGVFADFSPPMLENARQALKSAAGRTRFVEIDYGTPDWVGAVIEDAPYDAVASGYSIHHQKDERKRELYGEIFQILAPNGVFINVEHVASATPWLEVQWNEMLTDALYESALTKRRETTREAIYNDLVNRADKEANILAPVETQCAWLRELGFRDVDCYLKVMELAVFGGRK